MEQTHNLLGAIIAAHMKSDTGGEFPVNVLNRIGRFSEYVGPLWNLAGIVTHEFRTLHKIHTFAEAQQSSSKIKRFFRQGEMNTLLRDCKAELQQGLDFFQVRTTVVTSSVPCEKSCTDKEYQCHERHCRAA
jgi:hypothetical protein